LNAFWKMWLQFVFPFYTAGLFIIGLRYSTVLAKLFGNRSVPVLATPLFLSYTKLLHSIITALSVGKLTTYPSSETQFVWADDGNLEYGHFPHITIMLAALACLLLLLLPYTLLVLLMQWLRRTPNSMVSRWITRYVQTSLRCLLCSSEGQAPLLVWSATACSRYSAASLIIDG